MKIVYVPMDERPCNYKYPVLIARSAPEVKVVRPELTMMGNKKKPADIDSIWQFLMAESEGADYAILSLDTLYYGGLIPSRLHHLSFEELKQRTRQLEAFRELRPTTKIIAFESIMRSPSHDTAEEEPDYYAEYGQALHRRAYLQDKAQRADLSADEKEELAHYEIPVEVSRDYEQRREINLKMNIATLDLLKQHVIDFLVFPQDDSAPYGYTAHSQKAVLQAIEERDLEEQTRIYPGSDEVGCSLFARSYVEFNGLSLAVFPYYSSVLGPQIIPLYEDRPMYESLKSHVEVCGLHLVSSQDEADCVLAINSPGEKMIEAAAQQNSDLTYSTYRNLTDFIAEIKFALSQKKPVAVCDSAYANGGDLMLFKRLEQNHLIELLCGYSGWNTNCNSLGTTLAALVYNHAAPARGLPFLMYRYIEDVFYQASVRQRVTQEFLPTIGATYFDLKGQEDLVSDEVEKLLNKELFSHSFAHHITVNNVSLPWKRMFELSFDVSGEF